MKDRPNFMYKYEFICDYSEGAHPACIASLSENNLEQQSGYGNDDMSAKAKQLIHYKIKQPQAQIEFIAGGTLVNLTMLSAMLSPVEGVISCSSGHIYNNESGAIEATGHKVFNIPCYQGKISIADIEELILAHRSQVQVCPKVVYISQSTELGTIYSKDELAKIKALCTKYDLYLYIDGARLNQALASIDSDFDLSDIAQFADAFYIGGTKNGALLGEALVIVNPRLQTNFRYYMKQKGAILAKGRVIGSQFFALFNDDLYWSLARHSNKCAGVLQKGMFDMGIEFEYLTTTNQIFPTLKNELAHKLQKQYAFHLWKKVDENKSVARFVTSWATDLDAVNEFLNDLYLHI